MSMSSLQNFKDPRKKPKTPEPAESCEDVLAAERQRFEEEKIGTNFDLIRLEKWKNVCVYIYIFIHIYILAAEKERFQEEKRGTNFDLIRLKYIYIYLCV